MRHVAPLAWLLLATLLAAPAAGSAAVRTRSAAAHHGWPRRRATLRRVAALRCCRPRDRAMGLRLRQRARGHAAAARTGPTRWPGLDAEAIRSRLERAVPPASGRDRRRGAGAPCAGRRALMYAAGSSRRTRRQADAAILASFDCPDRRSDRSQQVREYYRQLKNHRLCYTGRHRNPGERPCFALSPS